MVPSSSPLSLDSEKREGEQRKEGEICGSSPRDSLDWALSMSLPSSTVNLKQNMLSQRREEQREGEEKGPLSIYLSVSPLHTLNTPATCISCIPSAEPPLREKKKRKEKERREETLTAAPHRASLDSTSAPKHTCAHTDQA
jgi:hypothetical protein